MGQKSICLLPRAAWTLGDLSMDVQLLSQVLSTPGYLVSLLDSVLSVILSENSTV